jgi:hypothetical protein
MGQDICILHSGQDASILNWGQDTLCHMLGSVWLCMKFGKRCLCLTVGKSCLYLHWGGDIHVLNWGQDTCIWNSEGGGITFWLLHLNPWLFGWSVKSEDDVGLLISQTSFYLNLQKWQFRTFVNAELNFLVCFTEVMARNFALHRLVNRNDTKSFSTFSLKGYSFLMRTLSARSDFCVQ